MRAAAVSESAPAAPAILRAPLFADLIDRLDEHQRHVLLDLGPARAGLIERLGLLRCRLDILDLPRQLAALTRLATEDDSLPLKALLSECLPQANPEPIGIVLCWDLLDYLPPPVTAFLFSLLQSRLATGTRLHALVEYSARQMPEQPRQIGPNLDGDLLIETGAAGQTAAPRHSLASLAGFLPGFQSERSMLLGNGMQEYLFRFQGGPG